ncbi:Murein-DD-endopeptidase [plant metagenome]|uniref:Murein-DD-endopeptidase n=1 Tax=plant metagenome TaxID=1297885 RepID=A0A484QRF6_9ZZZZ
MQPVRSLRERFVRAFVPCLLALCLAPGAGWAASSSTDGKARSSAAKKEEARKAKAAAAKPGAKSAAKPAGKTASKTTSKATAKPATKASSSKTAGKRAAKAAPPKATSKASSKASARTAGKSAAKTPSKVSSKATARTASSKAGAKRASRGSAIVTRPRNQATAAVPVRAALRAPVPAGLDDAAPALGIGALGLRSSVALVQDISSAEVLVGKNADTVRPIASITKLMTALVVLDGKLPMHEKITITSDDIDRQRNSRSRLSVGSELSRADLLHLALMSSENRAAHALGRSYPGGQAAFVRAMNAKAASLGMRRSRFVEPTGLSSENVSTPSDLVKLLSAAGQQPLIRRYSTDDEEDIQVGSGKVERYRNTNLLVTKSDWDITVSKTGFINEAGECLVMLTRINGRDLAVVLLNSEGKLSRIGDASRVRKMLIANAGKVIASAQ